MVLQLKANDVSGLQKGFDNYFDCSWISDYSYENEQIFMQSLLRFSNIYEISLNHSYKVFLRLFDTLDTLLNGCPLSYSILSNKNTIKSREQIFLCQLFRSIIDCSVLHQQQNMAVMEEKKDEKYAENQQQLQHKNKIPDYISDFFRNTFNYKNTLEINFWLLNINEYVDENDENGNILYGYQTIQSLFINNQSASEYFTIDFERLYQICPNVKFMYFYRADCSKKRNAAQVNAPLNMHFSELNLNVNYSYSSDNVHTKIDVQTVDRNIIMQSVFINEQFMHCILHFLSECIEHEYKLQEIIFYDPIIDIREEDDVVNDENEDRKASEDNIESKFAILIKLYQRKFQQIQWTLNCIQLEIASFDECGEVYSLVIQSTKARIL